MFMIDENHFTNTCIGVTDPLIKVDDPYNPVRVFLFLFVIDKRYNIINTLYLLKKKIIIIITKQHIEHPNFVSLRSVYFLTFIPF